MAADYLPIACATHERLEFAVLRRQRLHLVWQSEDGRCQSSEHVLPVDVETREGAEWLTLQHENGARERVRLDRILSLAEA